MNSRLTVLVCLLGFAALFLVAKQPRPVNAAPAPAPQYGGNVYCASDNGRRNYCNMDTSGGVQLAKQRSDSPCNFGSTWGFERGRVWVDRGCRAEFQAGYNSGNSGGWGGSGGGGWGGWGDRYNVYCASDDGRRNRCPVDTRAGVRLVRKRSDSPCNYGSTWGYDRNGIWVDRGCRADFEIGQSGWKPNSRDTVYCASDNMNRNFCNADTRNGVRLIRQRSESDCIFNRTWGYDRNRIWVDRGCRADFEVGKYY